MNADMHDIAEMKLAREILIAGSGIWMIFFSFPFPPD